MTQLRRLFFTAEGISLIIVFLVWAWAMYFVMPYLVIDFNLGRILLGMHNGSIILGGAIGLFLLWMIESWLIRDIWKRIVLHFVIFIVTGVGMYFWWRMYVVDGLSQLEIAVSEMDPVTTLKLTVLCSILFFPSILMQGSFRRHLNPQRAKLYQIIMIIGMCVALAFPIQQFWWFLASPIQPLSNLSVLPYGGSYHEAVKLIAGANMLQFSLIAWGRTKPASR